MRSWPPAVSSTTLEPGGAVQLTSCVIIMLSLQALDEIFSRLEGSGFCTGADNEDLCTAFLLMATYQGLPILAEGMIPDTWLQDQVCNQAVPGTC